MRLPYRRATPGRPGALASSRCQPWLSCTSVERLVARDGCALSIRSGDALAPGGSHLPAERGVAGQSNDGGGGLLGRLEAGHDSARPEGAIGLAPPFQQIATRADVAGDDRDPGRVCLQDHERLPFAEAGQHDQIDFLVDAAGRLRAFEPDRAPSTELSRKAQTPARVGGRFADRADDPRLERNAPKREITRSDERNDVLDGDDAPDERDAQRRTRRGGTPRAGAIALPLELDAIGNHQGFLRRGAVGNLLFAAAIAQADDRPCLEV